MSDFLDRVLQFEPHLRLQCLDENRAFLLGEREQFLLTGRIQLRVAPLLDGHRSVRDIVTALEGEVSPRRSSTP